MIPSGYKLYTDSSPKVTAKAIALLSQDYGYSESAIIDGKDLLFVVETHTWYGSQPDKPPAPHKGVTVYEKENGLIGSDTGHPLTGIAMVGLGLGYLLWYRK